MNLGANRPDAASLAQTQGEINEWSIRNFGKVDTTGIPLLQLLYVLSHVGGIFHHQLKRAQGIRGTAAEHNFATLKHVERLRSQLQTFVSQLGEEKDGLAYDPEIASDCDIAPMFGAVEELGEIAELFTSYEFNQINQEEFRKGLVDGLADLLVFSLDFAGRNGIDAEAALALTWNKVKTRDWKKNPQNANVLSELLPDLPNGNPFIEKPQATFSGGPSLGCIGEVKQAVVLTEDVPSELLPEDQSVS